MHLLNIKSCDWTRKAKHNTASVTIYEPKFLLQSTHSISLCLDKAKTECTRKIGLVLKEMKQVFFWV